MVGLHFARGHIRCHVVDCALQSCNMHAYTGKRNTSCWTTGNGNSVPRPNPISTARYLLPDVQAWLLV